MIEYKRFEKRNIEGAGSPYSCKYVQLVAHSYKMLLHKIKTQKPRSQFVTRNL